MDNNEKERLLKIRKEKKKRNPKFRRVESWRRVKVKDSWRKPRGIDNKSRKHKKTGIKSPSPGYGTPKKIRSLHPSGLKDILITHKNDLNKLNPKIHGVRINTRLGGKKKIALIEYSLDKGFKVFNLGITMDTGMDEIYDDLDDIEEFSEIDEEFDEDEETEGSENDSEEEEIDEESDE